MSAELFALQFAQASAGCVVAGLLLLALLRLAARHWPSLRASRAPWLLAQALCAISLLLALIPRHETSIAATAAEMGWGDFDSGVDAAPSPRAAVNVHHRAGGAPAWVTPAAQLWCLIYLAGVLAAALRLMRGQRAVARLLAAAVRDVDGAPLPVYRIDLHLSPMLLRAFKPVLLLPRQFDTLDTTARELIIAHEYAHLARRDPLWRLLGTLAHGLMWFNPVMASLQARLLWAQEAGCDRAVLAARGAHQRRAYAGALVEQFRRQQQAGPELYGAALAFGGAAAAGGEGTLAERMRLIREGEGAVASRLARGALMLGAAGAVAAVLALQPAYAWRTANPAAAGAIVVPRPAVAVSHLAWQAPLATLHVNSAFGAVSPLRSSTHGGIDLRARRGTEVIAAADGVVAFSGDLDAAGARYGKTIWITHADGHRSLYAHLDARKVAAGDTVRAGQVIALSGATGKVSGPHLHFEVRDGERPVDPASLIAPIAAQLAGQGAPRT